MQRGIDEEMFLYFSVIDENHSRHIDDNIATFTTGTVDKTDDDFRESNRMNCKYWQFPFSIFHIP